MRKLLVILAWVVWIVTTQPQSARGAEPKSGDVASLERHVQGVFKMASPAVVKITDELKDSNGWSGVIGTADGYVVSCAHHGSNPGKRVFVHLSDGRSVPAHVCGSHDALDIAVFKIAVPGLWPHAEFGKSTKLEAEEPCVAIGYPSIEAAASKRTPTIRMGRVVAVDATPWTVVSSCRVEQGDSGGGLFDLNGRLVGVLSGSGGLTRASTRHAGIELFEQLWNDVVQTKRLKSPTEDEVYRGVAPVRPLFSRIERAPKLGLGPIEGMFRDSLEPLPSCAVQVICDGEQKVLGTIVEPDGWILTKSSELFGEVTVRLDDGRELPARVHGRSHEQDLALLKVSETQLPQIRWSDHGLPLPGAMLAALGCREAPGTVGIVSHAGRQVPPQRGSLIASIQLQSSDPVPRVWKVGRSEKFFGSPFHKGDIVKQVEGIPVDDFNSLIQLTGGPDDGRFPNKIVGDRMRAVVERDGQAVQLHFQLSGLTSPATGDLYPSGRFTGFSYVYSTDISVLPEMCGGPVVDRSGQVVGVIISRANNNIETYVIPADIARRVSQRLIETDRSEVGNSLTHCDPPPIVRPAKVGTAAPEFQVETLSKSTFQIAEQRGKMVVLCFWMMHSELCTLELPALRTLYDEVIRDSGDCKMISLYTDPEEWEPDFEKYLRNHKISWPVAWIRNNASVSADYLTRHLQPCLVLVGPTGDILLRDHDVARFHAAMSRILTGRMGTDRPRER